MTVLEVGCERGDSMGRVVECGAQQVYGIDLSSTRLSQPQSGIGPQFVTPSAPDSGTNGGSTRSQRP